MNVQRALTTVSRFVLTLMVSSFVHVEVATHCRVMVGHATVSAVSKGFPHIPCCSM